MPARRVASCAAAVAVAVASALGGATSAAASRRSAAATGTQLIPQAGSAKYLVYTKMRPSGRGFHSGGLYVLTRGNPKPRRLASVNDDTYGGYSLAGSMLVYGSYTQSSSALGGSTLTTSINWFNLETGQSGQVEDQDGVPGAVAAAPDGWVTMDDEGNLADQPTEGPARSLGRPLPQSTQPYVIAGAHELLVYSVYSDNSDGNGEMRVMSFDHPAVWHTLIPSLKDATEEDYKCLSVTATYVACETEGARVRLIPLDGSRQIKTTKGCPRSGPGDPWVMHASAAWQGCRGKFTVLSGDGKVHVSTHRYAPWMVPAFGELAASSLSYRHLDLVSGVGKPKVLVHL